MKVGDVITINGPYLTAEQGARAFAAEELRAYFLTNEPDRPLTDAERDDIVYRAKWPTRTYTITDDLRVDVLTGHAIIPIKTP